MKHVASATPQPSACGLPIAADSHLSWMDLARLIAAFWVVTIHVAAVPVVHMKDVPLDWWWWANLYNCASRAAVPLFVMLSGALLLNQPQWDTWRFFKRRASKLLLPLLGWTAIYAAWRAWLRHESLVPAELLRQLLDGLNAPAYPHLWFLWVIGGLYLITPFFQPFVARATVGTQVYFVALWFAATALKGPLERWSGLHLGLLLDPVTGYVGYYVVGAIALQRLPARLHASQLAVCFFVFLAAWVSAAWGTYVLSQEKGVIDESLMEPLSGVVILMSLSAFLLIRHIGSMWLEAGGAGIAAWRKRMAWAGALSFGIYLLHPLVLDLLDLWAGLSLDPMRHNTAWYVPLMAMLTFVIAGVMSSVLRAIPGLRRLVP